MKTVKVTPDNIISVIDVNFDDFRDLQKAVGGRFEIVSTKTLFETFKMPTIEISLLFMVAILLFAFTKLLFSSESL